MMVAAAAFDGQSREEEYVEQLADPRDLLLADDAKWRGAVGG